MKPESFNDYAIIHEAPAEIGAHTVETSLPSDYLGSCAIIQTSDRRTVIAIVPNFIEACRIAKYAITPDGGYGSVSIESTGNDCTHDSYLSWLSG
jgi:hypothetical protein